VRRLCGCADEILILILFTLAVVTTRTHMSAADDCDCLLGIGGLGMSIEGPGKVDIKCFENPGGTCRVAYKPTEPGTYQLSVKYADEHIPGSITYIMPCLNNEHKPRVEAGIA